MYYIISENINTGETLLIAAADTYAEAEMLAQNVNPNLTVKITKILY